MEFWRFLRCLVHAVGAHSHTQTLRTSVGLPCLVATEQTVRKILDTERHPVYPTGVHHTYDDKYLLSENVTKSGV
jgi:hypothetical protein